MKDREELNRRAARHGLPVLWPEVEEYLAMRRRMTADMALQGLGVHPAQNTPEWIREMVAARQYDGMRGTLTRVSPWPRQQPPTLWERLFGGFLG